jgi:hypothetical protein
MKDFGYPMKEPTDIGEDNQLCIKISLSFVYTLHFSLLAKFNMADLNGIHE